MEPLRVGISSCLVGENVRYDGAHKRAPGLLGFFRAHVEWVPVCPELEVGMGVPREPVRLVRLGSGGSRMVGAKSGRDWTDAMARFNAEKLEYLRTLGLCGYVLKSRSPSCGLEAPLWSSTEAVEGATAGLFARALRVGFPELPIREESALAEREACESFLAALRQYRAGRAATSSGGPVPPVP